MTNPEPSKVVVCRGALATERRLLGEVDRLAPTTPDDLRLPIRVIVPSKSLRLHLLRKLVEEHGAVAGVVIQTLGGAAREIVERAGVRTAVMPAAFEVLVRRLAAGEPALASELEELSDGYDAVLGAVRDLVDAGFTPDHEDGVLERVEELRGVTPGSNRRRAAALVRVAARSLEAAEITCAFPRASSSRTASEALREFGSPALPTRRLLIHGFGDLTGVAADLLRAMLETLGGLVLLDRAPDPLRVGIDDSGNAFLKRFDLLVGGLEREKDPALPDAPILTFAEAPDVESEARWVAEAVRSVMGDGTRPESVGVVARHLGSLGAPLRRQFNRIGVPFSGIGVVLPGGNLRRKAHRLADLLRKGGDAELDLWMEVAEGLEDQVALLLGLRVLSLARLRDLAELRHSDPRVVRGVPLPLADGVLESEDGGSNRKRGTRLSSSRVEPAIDSARALVAILDGWPSNVVAEDHLAQTESLLSALGWKPDDGFRETIWSAATELAGEFPDGMEIKTEEWFSGLAGILQCLGEVPIGGKGGGVQLLTVMEARARTFKHLFVCGLNRGEFPRRVVDDPMLPDSVRARLAQDVLPEMPVKARSADEERYLFAQLVSSSPVVGLSWHARADGRRAAASPFVDRLRSSIGDVDVTPAPPLWSAQHVGGRSRPAYEHAVLAATHGAVDDLEDLLALAIIEGAEEVSVPAGRLAAGRLDVIRAVEGKGPSTAPGPWFGFVGGAVAPRDRLWITHLEAVATCPWRSFVSRRLGVRPLPDPHLGLPDPDQRLLGTVVHEVLDRIVTGGGHRERPAFDEVVGGVPAIVPWPAEARLEEILTEAARRVVYDEGLGGFGLVGLLRARARPVLAVAREVEWEGGGALPGVLAAEIEGELLIEAGGRRICFRADRLDRGPTATDYKTGKPLSSAKTPGTREKHLLQKIATGRLLQAAAYALAAPDGGGVGRYVFLKPKIGETPSEARVAEVSGADEELRAAFNEAVSTIDASLIAGVSFPRTNEPKGKDATHCTFCPVAEACRRDDSTYRQRLIDLMEDGPFADDVGLKVARRLWWLGVGGGEAS